MSLIINELKKMPDVEAPSYKDDSYNDDSYKDDIICLKYGFKPYFVLAGIPVVGIILVIIRLVIMSHIEFYKLLEYCSGPEQDYIHLKDFVYFNAIGLIVLILFGLFKLYDTIHTIYIEN